MHRALAPKPSGPQPKPRSIVVKFGNYRMKEEVLRRAWQRKQVLFNNDRFYVDHDFPPEVLKKRSQYAEAKKVLKEKRIKFQTPYPARMQVFYENGTRLFQSAAEATRDMASQGFPVTVVRSSAAPDQEETRLLSEWQVAGRRRDRSGEREPGAAEGFTQSQNTQRSQYKERLQEFRRRSPSTRVWRLFIEIQICCNWHEGYSFWLFARKTALAFKAGDYSYSFIICQIKGFGTC